MGIIILIGRILFALVFLGGVAGHFTNTAALTAYTESMGLRPGKLFVLGSAIWMLVASISIVAGIWADLGALMLAVFLVPTAFAMHRFWAVTDPETKMNEQISFNKDLSLAGAALMLFGFVVMAGGDLRYTVTAPFFG